MLNSFNELQGKQSAALKSILKVHGNCAGLSALSFGGLSGAPKSQRQMSVAIKQWSLGNEKLPVYPALTLLYLIKKLTDSQLVICAASMPLLLPLPLPLPLSLSLSVCCWGWGVDWATPWTPDDVATVVRAGGGIEYVETIAFLNLWAHMMSYKMFYSQARALVLPMYATLSHVACGMYHTTSTIFTESQAFFPFVSN